MASKKNAKTDKIAARAVELYQLIQKATEELDVLKEALRRDAETTPWRELVTPLGSIRAAFVDPFMGPRKGKDGKLVSLDPALELSPAVFDLFFHTETVVFLDSKDPAAHLRNLKTLALDERKLIRSLLEEKPGQVRLTLPAGKK